MKTKTFSGSKNYLRFLVAVFILFPSPSVLAASTAGSLAEGLNDFLKSVYVDHQRDNVIIFLGTLLIIFGGIVFGLSDVLVKLDRKLRCSNLENKIIYTFIAAILILPLVTLIPTSLPEPVFDKACRDRRSTENIIRCGVIWYNYGDYDSAISKFSNALEREPENIGALYGRGISQRLKGEAYLALLDFNQIIKVDAEYYDVFLERGLALYSLGKYNDAIKDFSSVIALNKNYADAFFNRALAYEAEKNLISALQDLETFISLNPDDQEGKVAFNRVKKLLSERGQSKNELPVKKVQAIPIGPVMGSRNERQGIISNDGKNKGPELNKLSDPIKSENLSCTEIMVQGTVVHLVQNSQLSDLDPFIGFSFNVGLKIHEFLQTKGITVLFRNIKNEEIIQKFKMEPSVRTIRLSAKDNNTGMLSCSAAFVLELSSTGERSETPIFYTVENSSDGPYVTIYNPATMGRTTVPPSNNYNHNYSTTAPSQPDVPSSVGRAQPRMPY